MAMEIDIQNAMGPDIQAEEVDEELTHELWLKGYCVLDMGDTARDLNDKAIDDIRDMEEDSRFKIPPPEIVDGFLGALGTSMIARLAWDEAEGSRLDPSGKAVEDGFGDSKEQKDVENLASLQQDCIDWIAESCTGSFFNSLTPDGGEAPYYHTPSYLVKGGDSTIGEGEDMATLTMKSCSNWLSVFLHAKLCLIYFMGPGEGDLELEPYFDDESDPVKLKISSGMLVVVRCDKLKHKLESTNRDYAIVSWLVSSPETGPRGWKGGDVNMLERSPLKELADWADERLGDLCQLDLLQGKLPEETPRIWARMSKTQFMGVSNIPTAVKGIATHNVTTHDPESLWKCINVGADLVSQPPITRWDHDEYYDPDPECYMKSTTYTGSFFGGPMMIYTSIKHYTYIEGVELFDHKFFQISHSEATGMDPQQRHILETSYDALCKAGYIKKTLMNSYIAVFSGSTHPECAYIDYTFGAGAGNQSQAIISNRTSFSLGMMGPSTSIDCEQAASAMAIQVGCSACAPNFQHRLDTGGYSEAAIVGGVYVGLTPYLWPRFNAYMNPAGRSCTFDDNANGWVKGESCSSVALKTYLNKDANGDLQPTKGEVLATIVGYRMTNNGHAASLTAPRGRSIQENMRDALDQARLDVLDVDAVETHGSGGQMDDAIEVASLQKVLRAASDKGDAGFFSACSGCGPPRSSGIQTLPLGAVKPNLASHDSASGMNSFLKVIFNILYANNAPNIHSKQLNGQMDPDIEEGGIFMSTESVAYKERDAFHPWCSRGIGGSNTSIVAWYMSGGSEPNEGEEGLTYRGVAADSRRRQKSKLDSQPIAFWPGGGSSAIQGLQGDDPVYIVGSWNEWQKQDRMTKVGDGKEYQTYTFSVTMGPNKFETFQIWIGGSDDTVMHPEAPLMSSGTRASGPISYNGVFQGRFYVSDLYWKIDATSVVIPGEPREPGADAQSEALVSQDVELASRDSGSPGDRYLVKLQVAGAYKAISWNKEYTGDADDEKEAMASGNYYIRGSFNDWDLTLMEASTKTPGLFSVKVPLGFKKTCSFYIVRNKDVDQIISPAEPQATSGYDGSLDLTGVAHNYEYNKWQIVGEPNQAYQVKFTRTSNTGGSVEWQLA